MFAAVIACAAQLAMAKPPEPLEEIFPLTSLILDAVVVEVRSEGKADPAPAALAPAQVVVLEVKRVLRGALVADDVQGGKARLIVHKPTSAYTLRVGVQGPWLLATDARNGVKTVLGRYGPDSWTFAKIDVKLAELLPANLAPASP